MSERFERLFSLPENSYSKGSPVVIAAGALLKDKETGKIIAQLKLKSICAKTIKAVKVALSPLDTVGNPLEGITACEYLDLNVQRDEEFGQKKAIFLTNPSTRSFLAEVTEVAFADNEVWASTNSLWKPLPKYETLEKALLNQAVIKQYRLKYGNKAKYWPIKSDDLWFCTCGVFNGSEEARCHCCGIQSEALFACDLDALRAEAAQRIEQEKEARNKEAQKQKRIAISVISAVAVCIAIILLITKIIIPSSKYSRAASFLSSGQYDEAIAAFEELKGFKDSDEQLETALLLKEEEENAAKYAEAERLLESGAYRDAEKAFSSLGRYKDSAQKCLEANHAEKYENAQSALSDGNYYTAYHLLSEAGDYKDAEQLVEQIKENHPFSCVEIGDRLFYGTYEQDNNLENGQEPIEWFVVDVSEDKVTLLSVYCLDVQRFNAIHLDRYSNGSPAPETYYKELAGEWKGTTLYKWLNNEFYSTAFSESEKTGLADPVSLLSYDMACEIPVTMKKTLLVSEYAKSLVDDDIHCVWLALNAEKFFKDKSDISTGALSYWSMYASGYSIDKQNYAGVSSLGAVRPLIIVRTDF